MVEPIYGQIRRMSVVLLLAASVGVLPEQLSAARDRALNGEIWRSDVMYYSDTDTYFQLIDDKLNSKGGPKWSEAATAASRMSYKGRNGQLAIIDDPNLQAWLINNFKFSTLDYLGDTWIGLQYICSIRELMSVTSERYPRTKFSFWDIPWYREDGIRCSTSNIPYMGVYIRGETNRWQAVGKDKRFPHYIVEYPPK